MATTDYIVYLAINIMLYVPTCNYNLLTF